MSSPPQADPAREAPAWLRRATSPLAAALVLAGFCLLLVATAWNQSVSTFVIFIAPFPGVQGRSRSGRPVDRTGKKQSSRITPICCAVRSSGSTSPCATSRE